jgi:2-polyprenyl-3-methyl-5-hydroxy-6-metoxy-1,4-benzoquinol methylase
MQKHNRYDFYKNKEYDKLEHFISYYTQFSLVKKYASDKIIEIGIGNKTLSDYLKKLNYDVTTCDYDKKLDPDIICDIRKINIKNESFDTVLAFEILEHIQFKDFEKAISELKRICKNKIIISLPYSSTNMSISIKIPLINKRLNFLITFFEHTFLRNKYDGVHYWEMGKKGTSKKEIKKIINNQNLKIIKEHQEPLYPYHYFFVLEK